MSYSREEVKAITDKILNMAKADAVEVDFQGGERSATRYANSSITANLIEHDQQVSITVYYGQKSASTVTHQFDDASLKTAIEEAQILAKRKPDNPETMPLVKPPQNYVPVDAVIDRTVNFGPAERAAMVKKSLDICEKKGVVGAGYIPKLHWTDRDGQQRGTVLVLPLCRSQLHPHLPYARRHRLRLGRADRPQGREPDRPGVDHRDGRKQGAQVAEAARHRTGRLHGDPRTAPGRTFSLAADDGDGRAVGRGRPQLHERRGTWPDQGGAEAVRRQRHASGASSITRCCGSRQSARTAWPRRT